MGKKTSQWYKSHINDEYVKLANKGNWRSRAVFKLKEIDEKYNLINEKQNLLMMITILIYPMLKI